MDDQQQQSQDHNFSTIIKELSDIKASLAVNTNETANIKANVTEIKSDIKEIKNDYIIRREFNEALKEVRARINFFQKIVYTVFATIGLAVLGAILKLVIK